MALTGTRLRLLTTNPRHAVPGGKVELVGTGIDPTRAHAVRVYFGNNRAPITRVSSESVTVLVPEGSHSTSVRIEMDGETSEPIESSIARLIADNLHPVANPAFDQTGALFVTFSGSRGQSVPVSVFRIGPDGNVEPFLSEIGNPTGIAVGRDGFLYISSRHDGSVYRVGPDRGVQLFADELGVATGIAFDREGILHVGDRRGTVFRIERNREPRAFCQLPPSVAAYHLAFDLDDNLFVTAPSLSSVDSIYRITPDGKVEIFCGGLGRPQGMAFDVDGYLYIAEGLAGDSGVYRFRPDGSREFVVSGPPLVGLAFDTQQGVVLATNSAVYHVEIGARGKALI